MLGVRAPAELIVDWFTGATACAVALFVVVTVLTVVVGVRVPVAVVKLLGDVPIVWGDDEFCEVVVVVLVLALGEVLP